MAIYPRIQMLLVRNKKNGTFGVILPDSFGECEPGKAWILYQRKARPLVIVLRELLEEIGLVSVVLVSVRERRGLGLRLEKRNGRFWGVIEYPSEKDISFLAG